MAIRLTSRRNDGVSCFLATRLMFVYGNWSCSVVVSFENMATDLGDRFSDSL